MAHRYCYAKSYDASGRSSDHFYTIPADNRYFHCIGNYRAVHECNNSEDARRAAEAISNCREEADNGGADSAADQEANRYGRGGGDCAHRYLAAVRCAYNPETRRCG
ncbi:hypothetical protein HPB50_028766 [Hyalomma asiaticum]|nr:hypothetical protein HPB50_028766 [Hyalomma asiaticum]